MRHRLLIAAVLALAALVAPAARAATKAPDITAPSAIVLDAGTGRVIYSKAPDAERPIASTTKLMTVLLTLEHVSDLKEVVTAPRYDAAPAESVMGLRAGERITVADLIRAAMIDSANDAAAALAKIVGGSESSFVRMMNRRAVQLGLTHTHYENPIGLDSPENYSSARDLVKLTLELRKNSFLRQTVRRPVVTLHSGAHARTFKNRNSLVGKINWIDGVKTGHTTLAHSVLVASGRRQGVALVSAVVGSLNNNTRNTDTLQLLQWAYGHYIVRQVIARGQVLAHVPVNYRPGAELSLTSVRTVHRSVWRGTHFVRIPRGVPKTVDGPIGAGDKLATVDVYADEPGVKRRLITTVSLAAANELPAASSARKAQDALTQPWTLFIVFGVIALAAVVTRRLPARERRRRAEVEPS